MTYKVMPHQEVVLNKFKDADEAALFLDPGLGKTFITIQLMKDKPFKRAVVFCPSAVQRNWELEIGKFWPNCPYPTHVSYGGNKRKSLLTRFLNNETGILIVNYEIMTSKLAGEVANYGAELLVLDESHKVKSHRAIRSKRLLQVRKTSKYCYLLTGTPILQDITDIFMQFNILDLGETFGSNFYVFQRRYMKDKNEHWKGSPNYFPNWVVNPNMLEDFNSRLESKSVSMKKTDVLDLPPLIEKNYYATLNKEQARVYKELEKRLVTEIKEDEFITVENALTKVLRLNQICAGHLTSEDQNFIFEKTDKEKICSEIIQTILKKNEKVIIWCAFKNDVKIVTKLLKELGVHNICFITGSQSTAQKAEAMHEFEFNPEFKVCVANLAAGGTGVNLIAANHSINYSRNYSLGDYLQSEARNYRKGSEVHSTIIKHNIVVRDSIEEKIIEALNAKRKIGDDVLNNLDKLKQINQDFKKEILKSFMGEI